MISKRVGDTEVFIILLRSGAMTIRSRTTATGLQFRLAIHRRSPRRSPTVSRESSTVGFVAATAVAAAAAALAALAALAVAAARCVDSRNARITGHVTRAATIRGIIR